MSRGRDPVVKIRRKRVPVGAQVDEVVVQRLEAIGVDIRVMIEKFLNEAAGHHVCPTCGSMLKVRRKEGL